MEHQTTIGNVLVGIDASGRAEHAVARGLALARDLGARVHVVHAVEAPRPMWIGMPQEQLGEMRAAAVDQGRRRAQQLVELAGRKTGVEHASSEDIVRVETGHPAEVILKTAKGLRADLILLGPHEQRGKLDFGSTARAILTHSPVPVWVQVEPVTAVRRILVPVDFSEHSRRALGFARVLAARFGARLRVMHAHVPPLPHGGFPDVIAVPTTDLTVPAREGAREQLERLVDGFPWPDGRPVTTFVEGGPVERILTEARAADLVVLGTHGRTGLGRFLVGSVAYGVLKRSEKPVLVVPSPKRTWLIDPDLVRDPASAPVGAS